MQHMGGTISISISLTDRVTQNDSTAHQRFAGGGLLQDHVGQQHVKHRAERAADRVESHAEVLEAQVVEGDHADEHDGQRQHLPGRLQVELEGGEVDDAGALGGQQLHDPAQPHGNHALVEGDEERRVQIPVVQQVVVEEHHGDGDEPVRRHHGRDLRGAPQERVPGGRVRVRVRGGERHLQDVRPLQLDPVHRGGGDSSRERENIGENAQPENDAHKYETQTHRRLRSKSK